MNNTREEKDTIGAAAVLKSTNVYSDMAKGLNSLNTSRGGEKGFKGFAFEEMHAADAKMKGHTCSVMNDNGAADLLVDGSPVQLKMGYKTGQPKFTAGYETVVVDKDNVQLAKKAAEAGYKVEESAISNTQAKAVSDVLRMESRITKNPTAPITGTLTSAHMAGMAASKMTAKTFVPFQAGTNIYDAMVGNKSVEDAIVDTVVDGAVSVGTTYAAGMAATAATTIASTALETAVGGAVASAATSATASIAATTVGSAVVTAAGALETVAATGLAAAAAAPVLPAAAVMVGVGIVAGAIFDIFDL